MSVSLRTGGTYDDDDDEEDQVFQITFKRVNHYNSVINCSFLFVSQSHFMLRNFDK